MFMSVEPVLGKLSLVIQKVENQGLGIETHPYWTEGILLSLKKCVSKRVHDQQPLKPVAIALNQVQLYSVYIYITKSVSDQISNIVPSFTNTCPQPIYLSPFDLCFGSPTLEQQRCVLNPGFSLEVRFFFPGAPRPRMQRCI